MLGKLLKALAYTQKPKTTFAFLHPVKAAQVAKTPFDLKTAYAPRLTALATALLVGPLAYRLGKRSAEGSLFTPRRGSRAGAREFEDDVATGRLDALAEEALSDLRAGRTRRL